MLSTPDVLRRTGGRPVKSIVFDEATIAARVQALADDITAAYPDGDDAVARVGSVSRVLLPTDGLWRAAMHAFQDPVAVAQFGGPAVEGGFPFLSDATLAPAYQAWIVLWVALVLGLAGMVFQRRDL